MPEGKIKEVFKHNLNEELKHISELIEQYNYVSMVNLNIILGYRVSRNSLPYQPNKPIRMQKLRKCFH